MQGIMRVSDTKENFFKTEAVGGRMETESSEKKPRGRTRRAKEETGIELLGRYRKKEGDRLNADGTVSVVMRGVQGIKKMQVADVALGYGESVDIQTIRRRKRSIQQREDDLVVIAEEYLKGESQRAITTKLNKLREGSYTLSLATVASDITEILFRWQRHYLGAMEERIGMELARLAKMEAELWDAWYASKEGEYERNVGEVSGQNNNTDEDEDKKPPDAGKQGAMSKSKSFVRVRTSEKIVRRGANPEYMKLILEVTKQRAQLLGIITSRSQVTVDWRKEAAANGVDPDGIVDAITKAMLEGKALPQGLINGTIRDAE